MIGADGATNFGIIKGSDDCAVLIEKLNDLRIAGLLEEIHKSAFAERLYR